MSSSNLNGDVAPYLADGLNSEARGEEEALKDTINEDQRQTLQSSFDPANDDEENVVKLGIEQYQQKDLEDDQEDAGEPNIRQYLQEDVDTWQKDKSENKAEPATDQASFKSSKKPGDVASDDSWSGIEVASPSDSDSDSDSENTSASSKDIYVRLVDKGRKSSKYRATKGKRTASNNVAKLAAKIAAKVAAKAIAEAVLVSTKDGKEEEKEKPIKFKDAVGRKFSFPFHLVKTWTGIEELIRQAFLHVAVIGPHVADGHYDLVGPDGTIILPQTWEYFVQPDWAVTMHMWPIPEQPTPPPATTSSSKSGGQKRRPRPPRPKDTNPDVVIAEDSGPASTRRPVRRPKTDVPLLRWTAGRSMTFRRSRDSERLTPAQPPPRPPPGIMDEGEVDNSYQAAQSMVLEKTYQAFDFKVLMLWDLLRLQRQVSDRLHSFREKSEEDDGDQDGMFKALAEYRTALRDWLAFQQFPRAEREDVQLFERHLKNNLSQEEYEKLRSAGLWEGNVVNLQINDNKAAGKIRRFLQMILPMRMATVSDEAQFEEHLTAITLGTTSGVRLKDLETQPDQDRAEILHQVRKHHCSPIVDSLARLVTSISGGLLLVIPMIVLVEVTSLNWRMGIVAISVLLFAVAVSQMSKASSQELLAIVAAYAAVLTVFFGQIG